jgi:hypothetical protein
LPYTFDPNGLPYFPLAQVAEFWMTLDGQSQRSPAFNTHILARDGQQCTVQGCPYDVDSVLDICHIIGRKDDKTVL